MSIERATYATQAQVRRAVSALKSQSLQIASVTLHPNGGIELRVAHNDNAEASEFDRLEAAGLL